MPIEDRRLSPSNFKRDEPLVSRRYQTIQGRDVAPGDPLHPAPEGMDELAVGVRMRLWLTARAVYAKDHTPTPVESEAEALARSVVIEPLQGGYYMITAPWLPAGEKVRGKAAAEARRDAIIAYGDPKGVTVEGGEGGWYQIEAAWLSEPEKVQGQDAAEARARELRDAGPPEGFDPNVPTLIGSDAFDATYNFGAEDVAIADIVAAASLAGGHDPAQWNALASEDRDALIQAELDRRNEAAKHPEGSGDDGQAGTDEVQDFTFTDGSNGYYEITGPGLDEPVKVRGREAFETKLAELREAAGIKPPPGD
jgi:hypothetical protein